MSLSKSCIIATATWKLMELQQRALLQRCLYKNVFSGFNVMNSRALADQTNLGGTLTRNPTGTVCVPGANRPRWRSNTRPGTAVKWSHPNIWLMMRNLQPSLRSNYWRLLLAHMHGWWSGLVTLSAEVQLILHCEFMPKCVLAYSQSTLISPDMPKWVDLDPEPCKSPRLTCVPRLSHQKHTDRISQHETCREIFEHPVFFLMRSSAKGNIYVPVPKPPTPPPQG